MATKISTEILIMILKNVQSSRSTQDLHSSLLVNRIWCKVTVPILWELTFGEECCVDDTKKLKKKALCIRTYISCMDAQARSLLTQNGFDLSSSPPQATFDYPSFTHKFIINNLVYFISIYLQQIIGQDQNKNNDNDNEISTKSTKSRILFREICKLIITRCTFLEDFKLVKVNGNFYETFCDCSDLIFSIFDLPGAQKVFKKLESFTSIIGYNERIISLYGSLALFCDDILNIDLECYSHYQMSFLEKLIRVQKRLENLSIYACYLNCSSLLWAIISQNKTLKRLHLDSVFFYEFEGKSSPIGQFTSLQELYIEGGCGFYKSGWLFLASLFSQLSSFHCVYTKVGQPQEIIIKILETANTNLRNINLEFYSQIEVDIFSAVLNYCTKITKLTLSKLSPEQVIAIFNNNFNKLRRFSFNCERFGFDADELLCQMGENIPESLETIKIGMVYKNQWIFSANSLRKFIEGWRGGNKKIIIKCAEQSQNYITLSDEHIKVIEEYGVKFVLK